MGRASVERDSDATTCWVSRFWSSMYRGMCAEASTEYSCGRRLMYPRDMRTTYLAEMMRAQIISCNGIYPWIATPRIPPSVTGARW